MASNLKLCAQCLQTLRRRRAQPTFLASYATLHSTTPSPNEKSIHASLPISRHPSTQPPSHKPPEFRRSQLHRQYTSLIKSTPLMVLFQHSNLTALEWAGVRRELSLALQKTDETRASAENEQPLADFIKLQVIKTGVFSAALRVAEYFEPSQTQRITLEDSSVASSVTTSLATAHKEDPAHSHSLSQAAHDAVLKQRYTHPLAALLNGPVAVLTFPSISTEHLKTALSILSPSAPNFPAPTRRSSPGYYELPVQSGLPKLMLLGARVQGGVLDIERTKWVGTINGGVGGLRAQLVAALEEAGAAITTSLEAASRSLYLALESRRKVLKPDVKEE